MTERLYDKNAYCKEFDAEVISCEPVEKGDGFVIELNRTAFYPEGGGQPGDRGVLMAVGTENGPADENTAVSVTDTNEKKGRILHITGEPLPVGTAVHGKIDWEHRFGLMQNYSGEHIVSGLIFQKYGYHNVGFHMGKDFITIDLDGILSREQLAEIERQANRVVWSNVQTQIRVYHDDELDGVFYRSKKELHGEVRIVTFPGADDCACCGTHVASTGEIGLIKIFSVQRFRSGVRIEMLCGRAAYEYMNGIAEQNHRISNLLSAKPLETAFAVERLKKQEEEEHFRLVEEESRRFAAIAATVQQGEQVLLLRGGMEPDRLRILCVDIMEKSGALTMGFAGNEEEGYKYVIGQPDGDLRAMTKEMNAVLNGRGGGKPFFVQGSVKASREEILGFLESHVGAFRILEE